jgi:hypothetical protein
MTPTPFTHDAPDHRPTALDVRIDALEALRHVQVRAHRTWPLTATFLDAQVVEMHERAFGADPSCDLETLDDAANLIAMGYEATAAVLVEAL